MKKIIVWSQRGFSIFNYMFDEKEDYEIERIYDNKKLLDKVNKDKNISLIIFDNLNIDENDENFVLKKLRNGVGCISPVILIGNNINLSGNYGIFRIFENEFNINTFRESVQNAVYLHDNLDVLSNGIGKLKTIFS